MAARPSTPAPMSAAKRCRTAARYLSATARSIQHQLSWPAAPRRFSVRRAGDQIYGTQLVSAATAAVTSETVQNGGNLDLFLAGATATGTTVLHGGTLAISSAATASNTVLSGGGAVELESPKATVAGSLTFSGGGNTLDIASIVTTSSGSFGEQAVISGFSVHRQDRRVGVRLRRIGLVFDQWRQRGRNGQRRWQHRDFIFSGTIDLYQRHDEARIGRQRR